MTMEDTANTTDTFSQDNKKKDTAHMHHCYVYSINGYSQSNRNNRVRTQPVTNHIKFNKV